MSAVACPDCGTPVFEPSDGGPALCIECDAIVTPPRPGLFARLWQGFRRAMGLTAALLMLATLAVPASASTAQTCTAGASVYQVQGSNPPIVRYRATMSCTSAGSLYVYVTGYKDGVSVGQTNADCFNATFCDTVKDVVKSWGTHRYQAFGQGGDNNGAYDSDWSSVWTGTR